LPRALQGGEKAGRDHRRNEQQPALHGALPYGPAADRSTLGSCRCDLMWRSYDCPGLPSRQETDGFKGMTGFSRRTNPPTFPAGRRARHARHRHPRNVPCAGVSGIALAVARRRRSSRRACIKPIGWA
jgi:hypothetical protein